MRAEKPICQRTPGWLTHHCGKHALAPLTGQDSRALQAFVHLLDLYALADEKGRCRAVIALHSTLQAMQPSVRPLAKRTIPQSLDWGDEEPLWQRIKEVSYSYEGLRKAPIP